MNLPSSLETRFNRLSPRLNRQPFTVASLLFHGGALVLLGLLIAQAWEQAGIWPAHEVLKKMGANVPRFGVCCSPLVVGNRVIVAAGGKGSSVAAFDTANGEVASQALSESANTSSIVRMRTIGSEPSTSATAARSWGASVS